MAMWQVEKRDKSLQIFDRKKIYQSIILAQGNIEMIDEPVAKDLALWVWRDLKDRYGQEAIITTSDIGDCVERIMIEESLYDLAKAYIIAREKQRQKARADKGLGVKDDLGLSYNQLLVMSAKYLRKNESENIIETPRQMFERVAKALANVEKIKPKSWEKKFFKIMSEMKFLPGGRTLANAGTINNQLANCFVLPMPDSVEGIFEIVKESAILKKNGGGVGFSFGRIRPKGDRVATTTGRACGPVAVMHILNKASDMLLQAGGRRSGNMVVLPVTHPDIFEFLTCKEEEKSLNHVNFSIGVTSKFMKAVEKDESWDLINPRNGQVMNTVEARSIFDLAVTMAWKNGDPGIIFIDEINKHNPTPNVGVIESVNLCGEQPLLAYEACNLGSINLVKHLKAIKQSSNQVIKKDKILAIKQRATINPISLKVSLGAGKQQVNKEYEVDWEKLRETVRLSVRILDNVVSICKYPLTQIAETVADNRKIGLGVMGWADMLSKMRLAYSSKEACMLAEKVAKFISDEGIKMSQELAKEKGEFPNWKGSRWEKLKYEPMRNATITTIAPTGSIAMIAGCSYGIEPHFALAYYKQALGGYKIPELNQDLVEALEDEGMDIGEIMDEIMNFGSLEGVEGVKEELRRVFVTAHDLTFEEHIRMQAAWQKYTDNAVSKTVNLCSQATVEDVEKAYMLAWKSKCKGLTVYRDSSRSEQVLNVRSSKKQVVSSKGIKKNPTSSKTSLGAGPTSSKTSLGAGPTSSKTSLGAGPISLKLRGAQEECPMCGGKLELHEGCKTCPNCAFSACSL